MLTSVIKLHVHVAFHVVPHWACQCMSSHKNLYGMEVNDCIAFVEFVCFGLACKNNSNYV